MTHDFNVDTRKVRAAKRSCRSRRQINDTPARVWTAIVDANDNRATALSVGDPHYGSEWKRLVCGCHRVWSRKFPIGGFAALIDRRNTGLRVSSGHSRNAD